MIKRLAKYKEIIIVDDYTFSGGGARPIYSYYRYKINEGSKDILFLRLALRNSYIKLILLLFFKNRIIINGIAVFWSWPVYLVCLLKRDVIIYLHEAGPHVDVFKKQNPQKFKLFKKILQKSKVAFVSEWQRNYFQANYSLNKTKVIYNAMSLPYIQKSRNKIDIVMIAYQTVNKNVDFFSKVADVAKAKDLPYKFHWIGGEGGEMNKVYHSVHVNWMGDQDQVMDLLNQFDILFFPSNSDTFGLVLMEAVYKGKRIITYKENGLAAYLKKLSGCRVFDTFNEEKVLNDIDAVLKEEVDIDKNRALAHELCDVRNLEKRLESFFYE